MDPLAGSSARAATVESSSFITKTNRPPGSTASYTEIAERIGQPRAARAVALACAANPIAIAIPCHRVIRTDASLSGYRWGVERKARLLDRERTGGTNPSGRDQDRPGAASVGPLRNEPTESSEK